MPAAIPLRFWCQDESRFRLKTLPGKYITLPGVKPIGLHQWQREAYWLYGAIEPATGECFGWECTHVDSDCFQVFLQQFSQAYPDEHHVMQVDNATFHTAKKIVLPDNVSLLFQPPDGPEVNPSERLWQWLKQQLKTHNFKNLEALKQHVWAFIESSNKTVLQSLTFWPHIQQAVSNI